MARIAADLGPVFLRLAGLALVYHGWRVVTSSALDDLATNVTRLGLPAPTAWLVVGSAVACGACIALGLFTRIAAGIVAITMFVAAFVHHATDPFERRELPFLYLIILLCLVCVGAGRWSLDARRSRGRGGRAPA